ncbi:DUF4253 domain-containing protein [Ruminococcus sp.]|uniref:DUF4253 domain-containing protein n=1 Tax=Ruminococcus sp. TaxID=41978 RepID=UPI0025E84877|nr:DUF4253 domain-containing protein [Ruminococcus sp.]
MGFFSKLFGNKEQNLSKPNENIQHIAELIGCEWQYIKKPLNNEEVFELYKTEYTKGKKDGYTPIILVPNDNLLEMINCNYEDNGGVDNYRNKVLNSDMSNGESFLKQRFKDNMEMFEEDFGNEDIYGEYSDSIKPLSCFLRTEKTEELILAKIPMTEPWKVFAWIPFGGWNECPDTEDMMAVCKYWHDKYNVIPAVISSDELQMYASVPINNRETALKVAEEHYAFCNDTVDQGSGSIKALASSILNSDVWYFWWD